MHIVKSVGVLSVAKILGVMYACLGLIFAPFFSPDRSDGICRGPAKERYGRLL
jgi:hypothetical protein